MDSLRDTYTDASESGFDIHHGTLFDGCAGDYDRYRPVYPDRAINDVVKLSRLTRSSRLLEVGCGTGKATVQFASRGYAIDCVDPGGHLVAFATRHCRRWPQVSFTIGKFENLCLRPRSYNLVFSAQAFHWIEPVVRLRKAGRLLAPGGSLALLYNYPAEAPGGVMKTLAESIQEESLGRLSAWSYEDEVVRWSEEISRCRVFSGLRVRRHRWRRRYSAEEYLGLFRTYSDYMCLRAPLKRRVTRCIRRVIAENGGYISRPYDCVLIHARKDGSP